MSDIYQILADTYLSKNDGDIGELLKQKELSNDPFISVLKSLFAIAELTPDLNVCLALSYANLLVLTAEFTELI